MIKKQTVFCTLALVSFMVLTLSITFLDLEHAWGDSMIKPMPAGNNQNSIAHNSVNDDMHVSNTISDTVPAIDSSTNSVVKTVPAIHAQENIIFNPSNNHMHVINPYSNTISTTDSSINPVVKTVHAEDVSVGIVSNSANNNIHVNNLRSNTAPIIDSFTNTMVKVIPLPIGNDPYPWNIAYDPTNVYMHITNVYPNHVFIINNSTNRLIDHMPVLGFPYGIAFNLTNNHVYVNNYASKILPVIATFTLIRPPTATYIILSIDGNGNTVGNDGSTVSTSITFQVTATQGTNHMAGFECSLDGSLLSKCLVSNPGTISYDNLAAGRHHTFEIGAVDNQGNMDPAPATFRWTVLTPK